MIHLLAPCTSNGARHHYSADHNHKWDKDLQILGVTRNDSANDRIN